MPRKKGPKPGAWKYSVGDVPLQLTAYERKDRGYAVWTRRWDGKAYSDRKPLCASIRDEAGRLDPEREIEAQRATVDRHRALSAGLGEQDIPESGITLAQGFHRLLDRKTGKYAGDTRWRSDVTAASKIITRVLGPALTMSEIRHAHYRKLWRALAHEHKRDGSHGLRWVEIVVGALQSCSRWLQQEGYIEAGEALPAPGWNAALRNEWVEITGEPLRDPHQPRYTTDEMVRLWRKLPAADPRLEIAVQIGAELRLGQVQRSMRSDIFPARGFAIGGVQVHGRGKKRGERVVLTMEQRHVLTWAMTSGVLADLEALYRDGRIKDYPLIPGGFLHRAEDHNGRPVLRADTKRGLVPWTPSPMRKAWARLERMAGVKSLPGRKWYGLRRLQSDRAEDVESDERILNIQGGWTRTETRKRYQEKGRMDLREKAAVVRGKIRPGKDLDPPKGEQ